MTIDYFIPALGQQEMLAQVTTELDLRTRGSGTRLIVIDNGSATPICEPLLAIDELIRNDDNLGMVATLAQAKEHSVADILIYAHSDFFIYEDGFDFTIAEFFAFHPRLGLIGAMGCRVAEANGGRSECFCSFRDGHVHGQQTPEGLHAIGMIDGCFLAFRRQMLDELNIPDESFGPHHFYERDWVLTAVTSGWRAGVINMDCVHLSGKTACQPEAQAWFDKHGGEQKIYNENEARYLAKWRHVLPLRVAPDWSVHPKFK